MRPFRPAGLAIAVAAAISIATSIATAAAPALAITTTAATPLAGPVGQVSSTPMVGWVPNHGVHALANDGTWIYLGGTFTSLTNPKTHATQAAAGLVRISVATGNPDPSWLPKVDGDIRAMVFDPRTSLLYLGGAFAKINGVTRTRLGAVSTSGTGALASWNPGGADAQVQALIQVNAQTLLVGGHFGHIGGTARTHVARISTAGVLDATFKPKVNSTVFSLAQPAGAPFVLIGGDFTSLAGQTRMYAGAVNFTTGVATGWNPGDPCAPSTKICPVLAWVTTPTAYYAAAAGPGGRTIDYDPVTAKMRWKVGSDGDNQALALSGSVLYIGGHFSPGFANVTRCTLAAVDAQTGKVNPFAPTCRHAFPGIVAMLVTANGSLVTGGDTETIGGTTDARYAVFPRTS